MLLAIISLCLSIVLALALFPAISSLASSLNFVDHPSSDRKTHKNATPVVGGIIIGFIVLSVYSLLAIFTSFTSSFYLLVLGIFTLFLIVGAVDDRIDIPAKQKFIFQSICALLIVRSGLQLESLNGILDLEIPNWILNGITVLVIVGALNAYNLVDGIDGLLGSFLILGYTWLLILAILLGETQMTWLLLSALGSLIVFLKFNFSNTKKVFMGDAGALSLGFLLIVLSIRLFEKSYTYHTEMNWMGVGIIAVLAIPVMDTIIVFSRRVNNLKSPFHADRTHLHHLIVNIKNNHKFATSLIISFAIILLVLAISFTVLGKYLMALIFIPVSILLTYYIINKIQLFLKSKSIIRDVELK